MFTRLIYSSRSTGTIDLATAKSIVSAAVRHNPEHGITGMLCASREHFLQVLEGERAEVTRLYGRIAKDPRHTDLRLILVRDASERSFGEWSMGYVGLSDQTRPYIHAAFPHGRFLPGELEGSAAERLLAVLRPHVNVQTATLRDAGP